MRVTVWNEHIHERRDGAVRAVYPDVHFNGSGGFRLAFHSSSGDRLFRYCAIGVDAALEQHMTALPPRERDHEAVGRTNP